MLKDKRKLFLKRRYLPTITDDTVFSSDRINVVSFDRHFEPQEQDKDLKNRLRDKSEMPGILNWCIDLSLEAIYSGLRMSLASAFNEHEYFSLDDVMAITGESREELLQRIEQCRQELIEAGENPDDYFKPVEPQMAAVYYFPNGLH